MQQTTEHPTTTPEVNGLTAAALRAEAWAGEAFLHADEDHEQVLAAGTARRRALDDALAEIEAGLKEPSPAWKVRYGLMLGLERVLSERPPRLASGTELRRHQIDALAGMLTELIADLQEDEGPLNGNGAGLEDAARSLGVLILTHRRLLVSQFQRDLKQEGYGERFTGPVERGQEPPVRNPLTIQTYAWFARHVGSLSRTAYQLVICDEAHTALGEKTSAAIRSFPEPIYIGMTATEQLIAKQVSDVFPASVDDLPLGDAARRGLIAPLRCLRVPPATVCMHLAPTASRRVYQQRIGRIMRMHPRKEAGVVVDFVPDAATHNERTITLHSLLDADFYRPGARVTPAPRRRIQRRARRKLSPAPWLVPVTPDIRRRILVIQREWERVDPGKLAEDEQLLWARLAGRQLRYEDRQHFAEKLARPSRECREAFLMSCAAENPNRRLRLSALGDRVAVTVDRADFDDLVTMVTSAPTWEKDRIQGVRVLLRAVGEEKVDAPPDIVSRWTWRLARATRKLQDRRASSELPEAKRLLGALTNSRGHRHEENAARLVNVALERPLHVAVALLASAEAYTPTSQQLLDRMRERLGSVYDVANALADNLPAPKQPSGKSRRRRRKKKRKKQQAQEGKARASRAERET